MSGREYGREILDAFGDLGLHQATLVFGSQAGKTTLLMVGTSWVVANSPSPILFVLPNDLLGKSLSETRWEPILRASPALARLIPMGSRRHSFKTSQQQLGGSTLNFVGSNSPANLASRPIRLLVLDEVDKFALSTDREADAVALAEQRTKSFATYQHWLTSTPTTTEGRIWQGYMQGDMRRYQVPCPACEKRIILAWSRQFTLLPLTGSEAWMRWDPAAKRPNGDWDLDRVFASAHCVCPHCQGQIRTEHKTRMVREGVWVPTYPAVTGSRSWHLPSLYVNAVQTSFGALAVKFLKSKDTPEGLQSFVTGELAEPWESQHERTERCEIVVRGEDAEKPVGEMPVTILTADYQMLSPCIWFVGRTWAKNGDSRLIRCGHLDTFDDLRQVQLDLQVPDSLVFVDSGYSAADVYAACRRHGKVVAVANGPPTHVGWIPCKGREKTAGWADPVTKQPRLWTLGAAPMEARPFRMPLLEFNGEFLRDVLARMRRGGKPRWELTDAADPTYFLHLDAYVRRPVVVGRRVIVKWTPRTQKAPDHLLDAELMQLAAALFQRRLVWTFDAPREAEPVTLESQAR